MAPATNEQPVVLYRCFSELEHAQEVLAGDVHFGRLDLYRDSCQRGRSDASRGSGAIFMAMVPR